MTVKNRGKRKADTGSSQDSELEVCEETHWSYLFCSPHFLSSACLVFAEIMLLYSVST